MSVSVSELECESSGTFESFGSKESFLLFVLKFFDVFHFLSFEKLLHFLVFRVFEVFRVFKVFQNVSKSFCKGFL